MKILIIMTAVIISIPFFVVNFWKEDNNNIKEVELKYLMSHWKNM